MACYRNIYPCLEQCIICATIQYTICNMRSMLICLNKSIYPASVSSSSNITSRNTNENNFMALKLKLAPTQNQHGLPYVIYVTMADLNKELSEYLLSNKNEKQYKLSIPSVTIPKPSLGKWFGKSSNGGIEETGGWFHETQKDCCPSMTRFQRISGFICCICVGILCFSLSAMYIPVLLFKARKFALLYSLGSLFFLMSFCFLWGPMSYLKSLFNPERRCFTISYFATLAGTLYFALHLQSTPLTVLCAVLQIIALLSFLMSHIPGGTTGLMFFGRLFKSSVSPTLPI